MDMTHGQESWRFLAASHDMIQPLQSVVTLLHVLHERHGGNLDGEGRHLVDSAMMGANKLAGMLRDLITYYRSGEYHEAAEPVSLARVTHSAIENLELSLAAANAALVVDARMPVVIGLKWQLGHVMQNLIGNAIKYRHPARPLEVSIGSQTSDEGWTVWVADNGIGIAPEHRERIFGLYTRLGPGEGLGLGLTVAREIIEAHGGQLWVESVFGMGSKFLFTLPTDPTLTCQLS